MKCINCNGLTHYEYIYGADRQVLAVVVVHSGSNSRYCVTGANVPAAVALPPRAVVG